MSSIVPPFEAFPSIPRLFRDCVISEKIDGTNALIWISDDRSVVQAGSRTRWITSQDDNKGFARWVKENEELLRNLGPGLHAGEWWGAGIGRSYGLKQKQFSLFNASRWTDDVRPAICGVVPVLYRGPFSEAKVREALFLLSLLGSQAAPGFRDPEGVVVYHIASDKATLGSDAHKGSVTP